jgi:NhaA family Na+:H+ antiporter
VLAFFMRLTPYLLLGAMLWALMLISGVHATMAGVLLAMAIPLGNSQAEGRGRHQASSPLHRLEGTLAPWVAFLVLPLFGFANAGVPLWGLSFETLVEPLSLGIVLGLFLGKQLGIMASVAIANSAGLVRLPADATWREILWCRHSLRDWLHNEFVHWPSRL